MTKWILAAGAAALAITSPALADTRRPRWRQGGQGRPSAPRPEKGGGGSPQRKDRGGGHGRQGRSRRRIEGRRCSPKLSRLGDRGNEWRATTRSWQPRIATMTASSSSRVISTSTARGSVRIDDDRFDRRFAGNGLIDGCPPGLAKKHNGCMPPGQAKKLVGTRWRECATSDACCRRRTATGIPTMTIICTGCATAMSIASTATAG